MVVGDNNLRLFQIREHVARHQLAALIIAIRIIRLQYAQAILDGNTGRDHQKAAREPGTLGTADRIDGLPGDQHRHDSGLSCACRQLECQSRQLGIGIVIGIFQMVEEVPTHLPDVRRNLSEPYCGFYCFHLTKKGANTTELVMPPMPKQAGSLRRHTPLVLIRYLAPPINLPTNTVDSLHQIVLLTIGLILSRGPVEHKGRLIQG